VDLTYKPPELGTPGVGDSLLVSDDNGHSIRPTSLRAQELDRVCPITAGINCRLTADLLAESIEIAIHSGLNILSASRADDDDAIIHYFRTFDVAARTARKCAEELRSYRRGADV
jgi:hypothetical protein